MLFSHKLGHGRFVRVWIHQAKTLFKLLDWIFRAKSVLVRGGWQTLCGPEGDIITIFLLELLEFFLVDGSRIFPYDHTSMSLLVLYSLLLGIIGEFRPLAE